MHTLRRPIVGVFLLASAVAVAACSGGEASNTTGTGRGGGRGGAPAPVPVTVATVVRKAMPIEVRVIGTAEPHSTVAVRAQVTGQLTAVNFQEGDDVSKDQVLFELDRRPLEAALQQAQANVERDLAQAANARAQAERYAVIGVGLNVTPPGKSDPLPGKAGSPAASGSFAIFLIKIVLPLMPWKIALLSIQLSKMF